jgi:hypothetical protein
VCYVSSHILRKTEGSVNENILTSLKTSLPASMNFMERRAAREVDFLLGYFNI